jgi:uncharacterized RDD family membrane protein YckC
MTQGPDPRPAWNPYAAPLYEPIQPPVRDANHDLLAGRGARFAARMIDYLLFAATVLPIGAAVTFDHMSEAWLATAILPLLFTAYQCYLVTTSGQSVGKKLLGLRVVRQDGTPVSFVSGVVLREWVVFGIASVPVIGVLFRLVDSVMIFGEDHRCLHDQLAGTKVIPASLPLTR